MSNYVLPVMPGQGWSVFKSPAYSTKIQTAVNGKELRSAWFVYPKYTFKLTFEVLRSSAALLELQTMMGFFNSRQGSFDSFLYNDTTDNSVTAQGIGSGNGVQTVFPLMRSYGGNVELVMNVNAITGIYLNGTLTAAYTVDGFGNVTFTSAPANGVAITWTGTYYYRCRFEKDAVNWENFMNQLWSLKELSFIGSLGNKV